MTVPYQGRGDWTKRGSDGEKQNGARLGVAVHWPGFRFALGRHTDCLAFVARLERDALPRDFAAIPYNELACQHGHRIEGRGAGRRSAANGSNLANTRYGSVCALLPIGGHPTEAMLAAIRSTLASQAPGGKLVTHGQIRPEPTACPGPDLSAWIARGAPLAKPTPAARTYIVAKGDTLWALAVRFYRDGSQWQRIAHANGITDGELVPGRKLRIP